MVKQNRNVIGRLRKAAENDDPMSNVKLAHYYLDILNNDELALKYFERARLLGDEYVSTRIGELYLKKEEYTLALKRFQEARNVEVLEKEYKAIISTFYDELASFGDKRVLKYLADIFDSKQEYINAYRWYVELKGIGDNDILYKLGLYYEMGRGVKADDKRAFEYYLEGYEDGNMNCGQKLCEFYFAGKGVKKDTQKAIEIGEEVYKAFEDFDPEILGRISEENKNFDKAVEYYFESAYRTKNKNSIRSLLRLSGTEQPDVSFKELPGYLATLPYLDADHALYAFNFFFDGKYVDKNDDLAYKYLDTYVTLTGYVNKNKDYVTQLRDYNFNADNAAMEYYYCRILKDKYNFDVEGDSTYQNRYPDLEKQLSK